MQVAKWGNSLAVRLPKALVDKLGLKEGDQVEISATGKKTLVVEREGQREREEALKKLRSLRWELPADYRFDREEAHERGWRLDDSDERR